MKHLKNIGLMSLGAGLTATALLVFSSYKGDNFDGAHIYQGANDEPLKVHAPNLPEELNLAGERVPLERFEVRERIDREMLDHLYKHSSTLSCIKLANRFFPVIEPILAKNGVPDDFKYLAVIESTLRNLTSPAGAKGYWQFMPATAAQYKLEVSAEVDERFDIIKSTEAACQYLVLSKQRLGSWTAAAAAYNAGEGRITGVGREQLAESYYDMVLVSETSRYVPRIIAMKELMQNLDKYGYVVEEQDMYPAFTDVTKITVDSTIRHLPTFAKNNGVSYATFKFYNPWLIGSALTNKARKSYTILIPKNQR